MGSSQSVEARRRSSYRLSKPRTNSAVAYASGNGSPAASADQAPDRGQLAIVSKPALAEVVQISTQAVNEEQDLSGEQVIEDKSSLQAEGQAKERMRLGLFRSISSQSRQRPLGRRELPERQNSGIATPGIDGVDNDTAVPPKADSMTVIDSASVYYGQPVPNIWMPPGLRTSWTYNLNSYEAQRILNLTEDSGPLESAFVPPQGRSGEVPEARATEHFADRSLSPLIRRTNSDVSEYIPMRRRSLIQTPGVATRTRTNTMTSISSLHQSRTPSPNDSRHNSFESGSSLFISMPARLPAARSAPYLHTPSDGDYSTIGAFRFGSLRITNGSPMSTPEPEIDPEPRKPAEQETTRRDYFTSVQSSVAMASCARQNDTRRDSDKTASHKAPRQIRQQLNLIAASSETSKKDARKLVVGAPTEQADRTSSTPSPAEFPAAIPVPRLADMHFTPFSVEPPPSSPTLQTTSKHTAVEDDLFEEEPQPWLDVPDPLQSHDTTNVVSPPRRPLADPTQPSGKALERSDSGYVGSSTSDTSDRLRPLTKADSGYSSNVSLRSLQVSPVYPTLAKDGAESVTLADNQTRLQTGTAKLPHCSSSTIGGGSVVPEASSQALRPSNSPKENKNLSVDAFANTKAKIGKSVIRNKSHLTVSTLSARSSQRILSPLKTAPATSQGTRQQGSTTGFPLSARLEESTSMLSIGSSPNRRGKLQRLLSLRNPSYSRGPPTVYTTHVSERSNVPSVPQDVAARFHQHVGLFPTTSKRLALKNQRSKDTLRTIMSVGSADLLDGYDPAPATEAYISPEIGQLALRHELQFQLSLYDVNPIDSHRGGNQLIKRKPVPLRQENPGQALKTKIDSFPDAKLTSKGFVSSNMGQNADGAASWATSSGMSQQPSVQANGRPISMTAAQLQKHWDMRRGSLPSTTSTSIDGSVLSPPFLATSSRSSSYQKKSKTPPPVSMRTRSRGPLKTGTPKRPNSTPPEKSSLVQAPRPDSIPKHPSPQQRLPLRRESLPVSVPASRPYPEPSATLSKPSLGQRSSRQVSRCDIQGSHGSLPSSRRNSLDDFRQPRSTASSREPSPNPSIQRPISTRPHSLSRRSSLQTSVGHDGWEDGSGRYPSSACRRHSRNKSAGSTDRSPTDPPYRVLHSHNSPAYRCVPIWG